MIYPTCHMGMYTNIAFTCVSAHISIGRLWMFGFCRNSSESAATIPDKETQLYLNKVLLGMQKMNAKDRHDNFAIVKAWVAVFALLVL